MATFSAAPHEDVLVLVVQIVVLLSAARTLGEICQRIGQPTVIGELLAGIVLGPSLVSGIVPGAAAWLVPQTEVQGYHLEVVSLLGAMFLLLVTGLEVDLALIRRHARTVVGVSLGGVCVTFSSGFLLGQWLPDELLADPARRLTFALFLATAMSISAIPVIAKVLFDLNLVRRDIGQSILAAGMTDDTTGWILLSIIVGVASGAGATLDAALSAVGSVAAFMLVSFTAGRWLVARALAFVQDEVTSEHALLTLVVVLTFAWGALTQALHLEPVLGAFVMGILLGQMPRLPEEVHETVRSITLGVFAPIFFGVAGLKVNAAALLDPALAGFTLVVIAVATGGKIAGTYVGARILGGRDHWTALAFGSALNARGAMEIIVATIGLRLGILSQEMFSIVVVMAMATSLAAPVALRRVLRRVKPAEEELRRLKREELAEGSLVAGIHRVLLPVRARPRDGFAVQAIEARLLERLAAKSELSITLLTIVPPGEKAKGREFLDAVAVLFPKQEVVNKVVESEAAPQAILQEAEKDYDLLVLGASEHGGRGAVFSPLVDEIVRASPCMTMVVRGTAPANGWQPRRFLVPTNGTAAAKHAGEMGFALAADGEEVRILNVVRRNGSWWRLDARGAAHERQIRIGRQIVEELREAGETSGVNVRPEVRVGREPDLAILEVARREHVDLILLGTDLRTGSDRLFLGPRVERILAEAPCPVVVVNAA